MTLNSLLWIDNPELTEANKQDFANIARKHIGKRDFEPFWFFSKYGYVIIENAVEEASIDEYTNSLKRLISARAAKVLASCGRDPQPLNQLDPSTPLTKILDTHWLEYKASQKLIYSEKISDFISCILGDRPLAFQSLHFEVGSTQAVHQDPAYVVVNQHPNHFLASWIALEDILPGSGELIYYPGSHRYPNFLYGSTKSRKHWNPSTDGNQIHDHHLYWLHATAEKLGLKLQKFNPRKGDALIWHSDLAHGGGEITDNKLSRRSLVTHYTRASDTPYYLKNHPVKAIKKRTKTNSRGESIVSMYYS